MTDTHPHAIFAQDENGKNTQQIAWIEPASQEDADLILQQTTDGHDGRSPWVWLRLQNGDLILGTFPQGDTYCAVETCGEWQNHDGSPCLG